MFTFLQFNSHNKFSLVKMIQSNEKTHNTEFSLRNVPYKKRSKTTQDELQTERTTHDSQAQPMCHHSATPLWPARTLSPSPMRLNTPLPTLLLPHHGHGDGEKFQKFKRVFLLASKSCGALND
jgi:hypothetical protein